MNILAIDTSSHACSVALLSDNQKKIRHEVIPKGHAEYILSFIDEIMGSDLHSLDILAWGCGPGSFTGVRIAASVIQAIGFARKLPIVSISSLAALAQTVYNEQGYKQMRVAVDARMNEVYWAAYRVNDQGYVDLMGKEGIYAPAEVPVDHDMTGDGYGVGSGWSVYETELTRRWQAVPFLKEKEVITFPSALAIAQLGRVKYERGEWVQSFDALPVYLRDTIV